MIVDLLLVGSATGHCAIVMLGTTGGESNVCRPIHFIAQPLTFSTKNINEEMLTLSHLRLLGASQLI
jgi:hypothetical protein